MALGPDACLDLVDVGATVVHAGPAARLDVRLDLARGATLVWDARPLVIADGAELARTTCVRLARGATVLLRDTVVLGRAGQRGGVLRSRTAVELDGVPLHVDGLDTADSRALRSPAVLGDARVLDVVACYGSRGDGDGVLQLAGAGTLHVGLGPEAAATAPAARAVLDRWALDVGREDDGGLRLAVRAA